MNKKSNLVDINNKLFDKALKSFPIIDASDMDTIEFSILKFATDDDSDVYGLGFTFYSELNSTGNSGMTIGLGAYTQSLDDMREKIKSILAIGIFEGCYNLSPIAQLFDEAEETIEEINIEDIYQSLGYESGED